MTSGVVTASTDTISNTTASAPTLRGPYPGLQPFSQDDAPRFFGRGRQINQMLERLEDLRFLVVVGASGCGKSSLVQAGLLPALKKGYLMDALPHWRMVTLRPGDSPLQNLAQALHASFRKTETTDADLQGVSPILNTLRNGRFGLLETITNAQLPDDTNVLVLVDQFEEIFRYRDKDETSPDEAASQSKYERQNESIAFVNLLLTAAAEAQRPVYVIFTMRSDFLGDCGQFQGLPEAINMSQFLTPRMTRDQLREAIVGPLKQFRAEAEPGLVDRILNEIGTDPDQLPLMQHALMRTWFVACQPADAWKTKTITLTVDHYLDERVGGIQHALNLHAEDMFAALAQATEAASNQSQGKWQRWVQSHVSVAAHRYAAELVRLQQSNEPGSRIQAMKIGLRFWLRAFDSVGSAWTIFRFWQIPGIFGYLFRSSDEPAWNPRQRICERVFRCLSDINAKGLVVRRLAKVQEIADVAGASVEDVLTVAAPFLEPSCSFLMADPRGSLNPSTTLDVSHEALLRRWDRLKTWVEAEQRSAETYRGLVKSVEKKKSREADYLRPPELTVIEQWDDEQAPNPTWTSRHGGYFTEVGDFLFWSRIRDTGRQFRKLLAFWCAIVLAVYFWGLKNQVGHNLAVSDIATGSLSIREHRMANALYAYRQANLDAPNGDPLRQSALRLLGSWSRVAPTTFIHDDRVNAVACSPDGETVLTGCEDGTAMLWDMQTGRPRGKPLRHEKGIWGVAFSPDGKTVLTGSGDKTARLWNAVTGEPKGEPMRHDDAVLAVAFGPNDKTVLTGCSDGGAGMALLWDLRTDPPQVKRLPHPKRVLAVAFDPSGEKILTGCEDNLARLWDARTMKAQDKPLRHMQQIVAVKFSPDSKTVITGSHDQTARLWDAVTGDSLGKPLRHENKVWDVAFSPDGQTVLTGSSDQTARFWDAKTCEPIGAPLRHANSVRAVAFCPDGKHVLTGSSDNLAQRWKTAQSSVDLPRHGDSVDAVGFSPDGLTVVTGCEDNMARLWHRRKGQPQDDPLILKHGDIVWSVALSPDSQTVVTGCRDGVARLWDLRGNLIHERLKHEKAIFAVAFSPDGKSVLTGSSDKTARLWDSQTGHPRREFQHEHGVWAVAFSPDGQSILTGSDDAAQLWNVQTGGRRGNPLPHANVVRAVAFSPDGRTVLTGCWDHTARLWDVDTGQERCAPLQHDDKVWSVAFSPDGQLVLTGSSDHSARLWDAVTGWPCGEPMWHDDVVVDVAFSPDGQTVLTGNDDGTAKFWDVPPPAANEPERLRLSVEVRTGSVFDEKTRLIKRLTQAEWLVRQARLWKEFGGPCDVRTWDQVTGTDKRQ